MGASTTAVPRPRCQGGWSADPEPDDPLLDDPLLDDPEPDDPVLEDEPAPADPPARDEPDPDGAGPSGWAGSVCVRSASDGADDGRGAL
ncbi:hypothetical protein [Rhodococcus aerolatus]